MNPVPFAPFIPGLMEPLVWLAFLAAVRPSRDRTLIIYTLILVCFGTAVTGWFTGSLGYVPWPIAGSYLLAAAVTFVFRKATKTAATLGVAAAATGVLILALAVTLTMHGTVDRTFVCENCTPDLRAVNGQLLKLRYDGLVGTFTNQGFAQADEPPNVNHAEVLARLAAKGREPFKARVALVYELGKLSGAQITAVDGLKFENFYYMSERTEREFIERLGNRAAADR